MPTAKNKLEMLKNILDGRVGPSVKFIGNKAILKMKNGNIAEITLATAGTTGRYPRLLATIMNKDEGEVTNNSFDFEQYLGANADRGEGARRQEKLYIWENRGELDWYIARPTNIVPLVNAINDFIEIYE
jgi:hypothetical protein